MLWIAWAGATDVEGNASPKKYGNALQGALYVVADERPDIAKIEFNGYAKGSPLLGTRANAQATVTCTNGRSHEVEVSGVQGKAGEGSWSGTGRQVAERLLRDVDCGARKAPAPKPPRAKVKPGTDRVTGSANPDQWNQALEMSMRREIDERPGIAAIEYAGYAKGNTLLGASVTASATVNCKGRSYDVMVENMSTKAIEGSWLGVADLMVDRLLDQTPCTNE